MYNSPKQSSIYLVPNERPQIGLVGLNWNEKILKKPYGQFFF